uniref:Syntabulin n=1 Tax=Callorhinchus milii TaxID=7868 RepID=A0A4W3I2T8_CALMI
MGPFNEYHKLTKKRERESFMSISPCLSVRPYVYTHTHSPSPLSPLSQKTVNSKHHRNRPGQDRSLRKYAMYCQADDTGCPSSQSVSPVKSPSKLASSPLAFPAVNEEEEGGRKLNSGTEPEWNTQHFRHKKDQKLCLVQPGSEADFSSSSSTGSISAPEGLMSNTGSKRSSASRSRGVYGRSNASSGHKQPGSPIIPREKDTVLSVYRNTAGIRDTYGASSRSSSSNSGSYKGSDSSPTIRRAGKYTSCSDNHGIKPPNPEQYLTPLQQKEVTIRHLRTKLKESENNLQERWESEVVDLKSQLARMREDWIEEECHRVEAQLALKEARKEIKQLRQVIDTMKNSLVEKDKGVQKYFIDINIQNKKLESLLQSMEMAQNGALRDDQAVDYMCTSPVKALARSTTYTKMTEGTGLEDQAVEAMADSGLLANDDMASRADLFDQILKSTAIEGVSGGVSWVQANEMPVKLANSATFDISAQSGMLFVTDDNRLVREQAIQTDLVPYGPDVQKLILHLLKSQDSSPISPISSTWMTDAGQAACAPKLDTMITNALVDSTPNNPNIGILVSKSESVNLLNSPETCNYSEQTELSPRISNVIDLNFAFELAGNERSVSRAHLLEQPSAVCERSYWSNHFIIDLLAVAVPVVPTLAWVLATHRGGMDPLYNIGTLMRGCCLVALHSLRHSPRTLFRRPSNAQNPTNCT